MTFDFKNDPYGNHMPTMAGKARVEFMTELYNLPGVNEIHLNLESLVLQAAGALETNLSFDIVYIDKKDPTAYWQQSCEKYTQPEAQVMMGKKMYPAKLFYKVCYINGISTRRCSTDGVNPKEFVVISW